MNQQIPNWFLRMREKVWERLSPFIGKSVDENLCKDVEAITNALIEECSEVITNNGNVVNAVSIKLVDGQVEIRTV